MTEPRKSMVNGGEHSHRQYDHSDLDFQIQISSSPENEKWDDYLAQIPGGSHIQTTKWAKLKAHFGWRTRRVLAIDNGKIIGGAQMLLRPLALRRSIAYVPRGPVMGAFQPKVAKLIVDTLKQIAMSEKCLMLSIQPPQHGHALIDVLQNSQFKLSSLEFAPTATILVDLAPEPNDIVMSMKRGTRYNIGLCSRKGIGIFEGDQEALGDFYRLLYLTSKRQNFSILPFDYFLKMWEVFEPQGNIKLFLAKYHTQTISAQLVIAFGDTVVNKMNVWSGEYTKLHPNEGLIWGVMQWARSNGYRYYDLEGIDREAAELILNGKELHDSMKNTFTHFKLGFGGNIVLLPPSLTFIQNPVVDRIYQTVIEHDRIPYPLERALGHLRTSILH